MQPIQDLPAPVAKQLLGICFDIDDTVTTHGVLDPGAYTALHRLRDAGLKLIAVTGRPLGWAEIVARTWPVDAAVGENGAGWLAVRDGALVRGYWDTDDARAEQQKKLRELRSHVEQHMPQAPVTDDQWARRCDLAFDVGEFAKLPAEDIKKLVTMIETSGAHAVVSTVHAHAAYADCDKPRGVVRAARELLSLDVEAQPERWLFVGDSGNDAPAFEWFPVCAGVANVRDFLDRLPRAPAYVARQRCGAGFKEIADHILELRRDEHA